MNLRATCRTLEVSPAGYYAHPHKGQRPRRTADAVLTRRLRGPPPHLWQSKPVWEKCDSEFYKSKESISDLSLAYAKKKRADIILP